MRYAFPPEVDRAFLVEALCAAGEYFRTLAEGSADAQIHEEYEIKLARCLRLVVDLEVDLDADEDK
jgi:phage gp36-like protein